MRHVEKTIEHLLFASRWLLAPVYLGLVGALLVMLYKFAKQGWEMVIALPTASSSEVIVGVLSLVDAALVMNLILIIIFSGYENFVSKMEDLHSHEDRPDWMGHIGFADIKIKLIGSIVAISAIELLKSFLNVHNIEDRVLWWQTGLHLVFVFSALLYAVMDRVQRGGGSGH
ncbi:TIGR00645 family protein [Hydrogenophilus thiooxidans]|uniref:TIGR00645 family protein n=1 Tax=Hydrogenophilus thiooxidans TaxID=2820326 RepID=UPI001C22094C|nr:TIGR00645 family protein [Hydrogenophilus thiooxidans]